METKHYRAGVQEHTVNYSLYLLQNVIKSYKNLKKHT